MDIERMKVIDLADIIRDSHEPDEVRNMLDELLTRYYARDCAAKFYKRQYHKLLNIVSTNAKEV